MNQGTTPNNHHSNLKTLLSPTMGNSNFPIQPSHNAKSLSFCSNNININNSIKSPTTLKFNLNSNGIGNMNNNINDFQATKNCYSK